MESCKWSAIDIFLVECMTYAGRHQLWISLQTKENLVASRQFRFPSHAYFCINTFLPVLKWIFNFSENRRGFLAQGGRIFQIRVDRLTLALWSLFQLESLSSTAELYSQRSRNSWKQMEATLENSGGSDWKAKVLRSVPVFAPAVNATVLHALLWRTEM